MVQKRTWCAYTLYITLEVWIPFRSKILPNIPAQKLAGKNMLERKKLDWYQHMLLLLETVLNCQLTLIEIYLFIAIKDFFFFFKFTWSSYAIYHNLLLFSVSPRLVFELQASLMLDGTQSKRSLFQVEICRMDSLCRNKSTKVTKKKHEVSKSSKVNKWITLTSMSGNSSGSSDGSASSSVNIEHNKRSIDTRSVNRPDSVSFSTFFRILELPKSIRVQFFYISLY